MFTIILGMIGFILIMCGHLFQTSGPAWLGFGLVICGVIIDLATNIEPKKGIPFHLIERDQDIHL